MEVSACFEVAGMRVTIDPDDCSARIRRVYDQFDPPLMVNQSLPSSAITVDELRETPPDSPCSLETTQYPLDSLPRNERLKVVRFAAESSFKPRLITTVTEFTQGDETIPGHLVHRITLFVDARWRD